MKRILRIMQSCIYLNSSGTIWLFPLYTILVVFMAIFQCQLITQLVSDYMNNHKGFHFTAIYGQMLYLFNTSSLLISGLIIGPYVYNRKKKNNYALFLMQLPVYKKDLFTARFLLLQLAASPPLICVLYFLSLNLYAGSSDYISAYSGFFTLIYCLWLFILSTLIGFAVSCSKKYNLLKYFALIPIVLMFILMEIIINVEYNMNDGLGEGFSALLKPCRVIGGVGGIAAILIATVISYLLVSKLPFELSEKEVYMR